MEVWLVLKEPRGMLGTHSESEAATTQRYSGARRQKGRSSSMAACGFRVCSPAEPQQSRGVNPCSIPSVHFPISCQFLPVVQTNLKPEDRGDCEGKTAEVSLWHRTGPHRARERFKGKTRGSGTESTHSSSFFWKLKSHVHAQEGNRQTNSLFLLSLSFHY